MCLPRRRPHRAASRSTALTVEILAALVGLVALVGGFRAVQDDHVHRGPDGEPLRHRHAWVGPHEHGPGTHVHEMRSVGFPVVERAEQPPAAHAAPAPVASAGESVGGPAGLLPSKPSRPGGIFVAVGSSPVPSGAAPSGTPGVAPTPDPPSTADEALPASPASSAVRSRGPPAFRTA